MDPFIVVLTGFGVVVLLTAWLPMVLKELPLSLPMVCVALGALIFLIPGLPGLAPHPMDNLPLVERLTEIVVIVALMGAGLKLDRPLDWVSGVLTWRLLAIAMPLTILAIGIAGFTILGLGVASTLLLAASLAPTDPVLASDVQVGAPGAGREDDVRYTLTSEAGLNDGLAFPFVNLAVALVAVKEGWLVEWLAYDVVWKLAVGVAVGWVVGRALGWLTFRLPNRSKLSRTGDGLVALGITAVAYGVTEIVHGYGFLAVFVAAVTFRSVERDHAYHDLLHAFIEQLERLLMMVLLVLLGGAMSDGGLLDAVDWRVLLFAALVLFVVRPAVGWFSLAGRGLPTDERAVISFFGIRGLGTAYYLAYGMVEAKFEGAELIWSTAAVIVLVSVVMHGVTVTPVMRALDRRSRKRGAAAGTGSSVAAMR
ncbi:cation:proton antiporter [Chthonobacter albigriseus]|uniref:cation:proton antiporter n=1 Tax=Chthonobacter albigriseus TaxID=1683161 RepID=UPI0015EF75BB|nr:cation:proton antiporter [Chthonobacter albigriseus]